MELYEKGKNNSLLSDTVQDVKDEIIEAFYSEEGDLEENIDVIEVKGAKYFFFSSHSLKTREKYISFTQLVLLSLYIF
jgi:hypothetical protein